MHVHAWPFTDIASISFTRINFTCVRTEKLHDSEIKPTEEIQPTCPFWMAFPEECRFFFPRNNFTCDDTVIRPLRFLSLEHSNYILCPEPIAVFMDEMCYKCYQSFFCGFPLRDCSLALMHRANEPLMGRQDRTISNF